MGELAALADILREKIMRYAPDGNLPRTHLNEMRKIDGIMREEIP